MRRSRFAGCSVSLSLLFAAAFSMPQDAVPADTLPDELPRTAPLGLPARIAEGHPSDAVVALGRRLFFDPVLSADRTVACASCHDPAHGFADPRPLSVGVGGRKTLRNAPTLFNRALGEIFMWDGSAATLEEQVLKPIGNEREMALGTDAAIERLRTEYGEAFDVAFGEPATPETLATALAAFVRRLWLGDQPVDRFREGEISALNADERGGMWLFESRGGCWRCHVGANFSDEAFHNTGVGAVEGVPEPGREAITGREEDRGGFKTPTLRALSKTAPYMHDGSLATIEDVVQFYRDGGHPNSHLDEDMKPLELTDEDAAKLVAFLKTL